LLPIKGRVSPTPLPSDLLARVADLRAHAFELVHDLPRMNEAVVDDVSLASVRMQSVANELGVIEGLLTEAAGGFTLRGAA
jgi:hypothetical protein